MSKQAGNTSALDRTGAVFTIDLPHPASVAALPLYLVLRSIGLLEN